MNEKKSWKQLEGPSKYKIDGPLFEIGEGATLQWLAKNKMWELIVDTEEVYLSRGEMNRIFQKVKLYRRD